VSSCGWFPLSHDEIVAWVDSHRDQLPGTLAELSAFPIAFRRVIVNQVSAEKRTIFWQDHLRSFLGPDSTLSTEQRSFIEEVIDLLPHIFAGSIGEAQARMKPLEERTRVLFQREQAFAMFGMVGPHEPEGVLSLPPGTRLTPIA
jgi:hypothetical protein